MRKKIAISIAFAGLVGIYCWGLVVERRGWPPRYPGLAAANSAITARLLELWPESSSEMPWERSSSAELSEFAVADDPRAALLSATRRAFEPLIAEVRRVGPKAALPLIAAAVDRYRGRQIYDHWSWREDAAKAAPFTTLAELGVPDANSVLLAILRDDEAADELRRGAVIALCWEGNVAALGPLCEFVLDRHSRNNVRRDVLYRLPRFETDAPRRLRELLFEPFDGIDTAAAATLMRLGDVEAPSLVLEGLEHAQFADDNHWTAAVQAVTGVEVIVEDALDTESPKKAAAYLRSWLERHPEALDTEFERARSAYLMSERRQRELALDSFDSISTADDEEFDFGAAALCYFWPDQRERRLEQLWRLSEGMNRRLAGATSGDETLEILTGYLLKRELLYQYDPLGSLPYSFLQPVLDGDVGNCLGYTSLFVAVAERIDLPLRSVRAPDHVFVRYDDGEFRCNLELTARGKRMTDDEFVQKFEIDPASLSRGVFLVDCTKRQLLADVLVNLSSVRVGRDKYERAFELADQAVKLDPDEPLAYFNRARARFETDLDANAEILADLDRALAIWPGVTLARLLQALLAAEMGRLDEALALARAGSRLERDTAGYSQLEVVALLRLERFGEARAAVDRLDLAVRSSFELALAVLESPENERAIVATRVQPDPSARPRAAWLVAEAARGRETWEAVLALLPSDEQVGTMRAASAGFPGFVHVTDPHAAAESSKVRGLCHLVRARAHVALGNLPAAQRQLEAAREEGANGRYSLRVARLVAQARAKAR